MMTRQKKLLFTLAFVFIVPGMLAILLYKYPGFLGGLPTNKGTFITPAKQVSYLPTEGKGWHVLVWCEDGCSEACLGRMDEMARMRLALGRKLYDVNIWLLHDKETKACSAKTQEMLKANAIRYQATTDNILDTESDAEAFVADPRGYLILKYMKESPVTKHIYDDLKHLLSAKGGS